MKKILTISILFFCCLIHAQVPSEDPYYAQSGDPSPPKIFDDISLEQPSSIYIFSVCAGEKIANEYIESLNLIEFILSAIQKKEAKDVKMYFSTEVLLQNLKALYGDSVAQYKFSTEAEELIFLIATKNIQFFYRSILSIKN